MVTIADIYLAFDSFVHHVKPFKVLLMNNSNIYDDFDCIWQYFFYFYWISETFKFYGFDDLCLQCRQFLLYT